jgi:hypothetical protein
LPSRWLPLDRQSAAFEGKRYWGTPFRLWLDEASEGNHDAELVRLLDGPPDPHRFGVVRKLPRAVETYDICFTVDDTRMADQSEGTGQVPMRAV